MTEVYPEQLLTEKQVAAWLAVSLPTMQRWRSSGSGPRFVQLSLRRIGYRRNDVEAWLTMRTIDRIGAFTPIQLPELVGKSLGAA